MAQPEVLLGFPPCAASQIPLIYGVGHYGGDFGLAISVEQNVTKFDSHTDAVRTLFDGKAQVLAIVVLRHLGRS